MIIIRNKIIPIKGFRALTIWPIVFVRSDMPFFDVDENHERIHGRQQVELLWLPFFIIYIVEWMIRKLFGKGRAYRNISFEREAYANQHDFDYVYRRKFWRWLRYIRR
jgi:hypothetical protein